MSQRRFSSTSQALPGSRTGVRNYDPAHKAIHQGEKSLAEITSMVQQTAEQDSWHARDMNDFPLMIAVAKPTLWEQKLLGHSFKWVLSCSVACGSASGVWFGFMLYGSYVHTSIASVLKFLG